MVPIENALKTVGISPKVAVAALVQIVGLIISWIQGGAFGVIQCIQLGIAVLTVVGGILAKPGSIQDAEVVKTIGFSPKTVVMSIISVLGFVVVFIQQADFSGAAIVSLVITVLTALGAYQAGPGQLSDAPDAEEPAHPDAPAGIRGPQDHASD